MISSTDRAPGLSRPIGEHALQGFDGARAYNPEPEREEPLLTEVMGLNHGAWREYLSENGCRPTPIIDRR